MKSQIFEERGKFPIVITHDNREIERQFPTLIEARDFKKGLKEEGSAVCEEVLSVFMRLKNEVNLKVNQRLGKYLIKQ